MKKRRFFKGIPHIFKETRKILLLELFCVVLPLFVTDGVILSNIINAEKKEDYREVVNISDSVKYILSSANEVASLVMQEIYINKQLNDFVSSRYVDPLDYYNNHLDIVRSPMFALSIGAGRVQATLFSDKEGIISGGSFHQLDDIKDLEWYNTFLNSGKDTMLLTRYEKVNWQERRYMFLVMKMNYYNRGSRTVCRLDFDYSNLKANITGARYSSDVYVCNGDNIIFTNTSDGGVYDDYKKLPEEVKKNAAAHNTININDATWDIYVMSNGNIAVNTLKNSFPIIALLFILNVLVTYVMLNLFNREYKEMIRRQDMSLAKQQAELHALHSQINPHFLFNALESIRMHSVLKNEFETAQMVEKLAVMQRQNIDWSQDTTPVSEEVKLVEAYLELQKYRFGDRLKYEIEVDDFVRKMLIPKLSLVTFVENACVHGMENKTTTCYIFVRVYENSNNLILEIEDTGNGIKEDDVKSITEKMNNVSMKMITETEHGVGMLNAALRLKIFTGGNVKFELESEEGSGTICTIIIDNSRGDNQEEK